MAKGKPIPGSRLRIRTFADYFPFGPAPFVILLMTVFASGYLVLHPIPRSEANLRLWTFTSIHSDAYIKGARSFEEKHKAAKVKIELFHLEAATSRLRSAFWADLDVPDLIEMEISRAGSFFRGPIDQVGFEDLTPFLKQSGLLDRLVAARLAPYTNRGKIFGIPHDVHPVMLAYRADLVEQLDIDVEKLKTWDDFIREGRRVTILGKRYMLNLSRSLWYSIEIPLFQKGGGYFDANGGVIFDNETAIETIKWYVPLVAGEKRISADPGMFGPPWVRSVEDGYCLFFFCPDWKSRQTEKQVPSMKGKMKLMPLPAFEPGQRRTSTWGGTMLGITKKCANKELAWKLVQHLYTDRESLAKLFRETNILPAVKDVWDHPAFQQPKEYWCGQRLGVEYSRLAEEVPPQHSSPFLTLAKSELGKVVAQCAIYYEETGEEGFDRYVRKAVAKAASVVRRQMKRNPF